MEDVGKERYAKEMASSITNSIYWFNKRIEENLINGDLNGVCSYTTMYNLFTHNTKINFDR